MSDALPAEIAVKLALATRLTDAYVTLDAAELSTWQAWTAAHNPTIAAPVPAVAPPTAGTDAASAVAGIIDPAEARRIARDLGLRVEFDERPLPDPDCADCAGSGWRSVEEGSTRVEPCSCMASNVTPLRRTS